MKSKTGKIVRITKFDISSKLRLEDAIEWQPKNRKIQYLIDNHPIDLWNRIHNRSTNQKKISLVRPAYASLKERVRELNPSLVEKVETQHKKHKAIRKFKNEMAKGQLGTIESKFKSVPPKS